MSVPIFRAAHRWMFFLGMVSLMLGSAWWGLHLLARAFAWPLWALELGIAPIWAHSFLMLFTVFPTFFFGFLFTVFPRWMNGPQVPRGAYVATGALMIGGTVAWLAGVHTSAELRLLGAALAFAGIATATVSLVRVLLAAQQAVNHAYVVLLGLVIELVALAGFMLGLARSSDFALHFAVRTALWGGLLPVFFAVCHRMVPFFSQNAIRGYVAWRPNWMLVAVVGVACARLLLGTAGTLRPLVVLDVALFALTATCAVRWTSFRARGNPLAWTLYAGFAWLPIAALLQTVRDLGFDLTGEWWLGRAPIHALGMGFYAGMLMAMVTRVTMGHSGRALEMDRITLGCFLGLQAATLLRVTSEVVTAPMWMQHLLLCSVLVWLAAFGLWTWRLGRIYLAPRVDGQPG